MLIGEHKARIGEKNRTALPKVFRKELDEKLIITRGYEGCLIIVDKTRWKRLIEIIEQRPLTNLDVRNTKRFLVGGAQEIRIDAQGRFVINDNLIDYAHLEKELIFVGIQDWVELWDLDSWNQKIAQISKSAADIADRLSNIDDGK